MATWETPLPKNGEPIVVGDPDHDVIHTQTVDCIEELRDMVDAVEASVPTVPTADTLSGATTVGRAVMKASDATAARSAIGAGTSNLAIGTTSTTAKAGDYVPTYSEVTGKPSTFAPTIGTTSTTAAAGNHTHTASTVSATAVGPGTATNVQAILVELEARIAALEAAIEPA
ncbi:hypothetical protein OIE82_27140 [Streptomyces althioticus]|uniref:Head fiber protein n=1 Tax=Streptomyces althioticus TaxID=83380 RepID=A0ABZ1YAN3_9ACTN